MSKIFLIITLFFVSVSPSQEAIASYKKAQTLYKKGDYEKAAELYYRVFRKPKDIAQKRKAEWGLAQSLKKIGLLYSASKFYSIVARRGRKSNNPFFRPSLEQLGNINVKLNLGQSQIVQLFKSRVRPSDVPGPARGFYFYYKGIEAFNDKRYETANGFFKKVPSSSGYYRDALFHLGVVSTLSGQHSKSINYFEKVISLSKRSSDRDEIRDLTYMNIARINYELKRFPQAISYYGRIPRDSDLWLDALWEASWAFFFIQKFNNTLGNIHTLHSPFFSNRFYPESYILSAITYLRLCRYDEVKDSMRSFKKRYSPVFGDVKSMLARYKSDPAGFFKLIYDYANGRRNRYRNAEQIIRSLSQVDAYRGARDTVRFADRELDLLRNYGMWGSSGLLDNLRSFLNAKKKAAVMSAGRLLFNQAGVFYTELLELSNQTKLIVAEMQLGKLAKLRSLINVGSTQDKGDFIGGLQRLNLKDSLEYWPFEGEYWEDELGFYVYNLDSLCKASK